MGSMKRRCSKCQKWLTLDNFYYRYKKYGWLRSECKKCFDKRNRRIAPRSSNNEDYKQRQVLLERARKNALLALKHNYPDLWKNLYAQEKAKAKHERNDKDGIRRVARARSFERMRRIVESEVWYDTWNKERAKLGLEEAHYERKP